MSRLLHQIGVHMTEQALEKAISIKRKLDTIRERKKDLEVKEALCWGNTSEVAARKFEIVITDGTVLKSISITPQSAKMAMNNELKHVNEIESNLLSDLKEV